MLTAAATSASRLQLTTAIVSLVVAAVMAAGLFVGNADEVADHLKRDTTASAGPVSAWALAYAPEVAAAMLQRRQAGAIIAARIVEEAAGMVATAAGMNCGMGLG